MQWYGSLINLRLYKIILFYLKNKQVSDQFIRLLWMLSVATYDRENYHTFVNQCLFWLIKFNFFFLVDSDLQLSFNSYEVVIRCDHGCQNCDMNCRIIRFYDPTSPKCLESLQDRMGSYRFYQSYQNISFWVFFFFFWDKFLVLMKLYGFLFFYVLMVWLFIFYFYKTMLT